MTPEEFIELTRGKRITWTSFNNFSTLDKHATIEEGFFIIPSEVDEYGNIFCSEIGANYRHSSWVMGAGLHTSDMPDTEFCWHILEDLDKNKIIRYNNALREVESLILNNLVDFNDDGTLKLKNNNEGS